MVATSKQQQSRKENTYGRGRVTAAENKVEDPPDPEHASPGPPEAEAPAEAVDEALLMLLMEEQQADEDGAEALLEADEALLLEAAPPPLLCQGFTDDNLMEVIQDIYGPLLHNLIEDTTTSLRMGHWGHRVSIHKALDEKIIVIIKNYYFKHSQSV
jgi:hypothetical protein